MTYLKSRIDSPGLAATVALHAAFGLALLQFDSAPSSAAAVPVMVSLIDSAGQERAIAPPKPAVKLRHRDVPVAVPRDAKPRTMPEMPPPVPMAKASEPVPVELPPADDTAALESSITLPRFSADYLNNPPPVYPALARRLGEQGRVMLRVLVRADGTPVEVEIDRSSGFARLDRAALDAVRKWRFIPARRGDTPVTAPVLVPISFTLEG